MKSITKITLITIVAILYSCYEEKPREATRLETHPKDAVTLTASKIPDLSSDYLVSVYENQELIKISEDNKELRKMYCEQSFLEKENLFISMGIGSLRNPETGEAIPQHLAERVANIDARRWASYGEMWLNNDYEPSFGKLQSNFKRTVTVIDKTVIGDSLFVFVATSLP
jgi:hypothetical protein